jgi:hypothetical protein
MANKITGVLKKSKNSSINGLPGKQVKVSTDILSKINRETKAKVLARYTKDGFDWSKWTLPIVAQFPNGEVYLLDGDHRRHMHKQFLPDRTEMSAWQIQVDSEEHYHQLFTQINSTHRKNVNPDEQFIHRVYAGDEAAVILRDQLENCGLSVRGSPEDGGTLGASGSPHVKSRDFEKALKTSDEASVKKAVKIIEKSWTRDIYPKWADRMHGDLLQAFSIIYHNYKYLSDGSDFQKDFDAWAGTVLSTNPPNEVVREYRKKGSKFSAFARFRGHSTALAIVFEFRKANFRGARTDRKSRQSKLPPKNIKRLIK